MERRTTVMVDDERIGRVQDVLGTTGIKDTIDAALDEVWRRHLRERFIERLRTGEGIDIGPEMLDQVRPAP